MFKLPKSPRLFLRLVRGIERVAVALEESRDATLHVHRIPTAARESTDDTPDDDLVSYATDRDTWERQQRDDRRRQDGFPVEDALAPPRH